MSIDPVTFGQTGDPRLFNRYAYTFNDPINHTDPDGELGIFGAFVGGAVGFIAGSAVNAAVQFAANGSVDVSDAIIAGAAAGGAGAAIGFNPALAANPTAIAAIAGVANISGSIVSDVANQVPVDPGKAAIAGVAGVIAGPLGAKAGDAFENALGASASSVLGETLGAAVSEGTVAGLTVGSERAPDALSGVGGAVMDAIIDGQGGQTVERIEEEETAGG